jgi:N-glycosylase/DNA lyase
MDPPLIPPGTADLTAGLLGPLSPLACGLAWGDDGVLFTPAYWASQLRLQPDLLRHGVHRLGSTLKEEIVACMLGGHGIPADVGLAAFSAIRESGLLDQSCVSPSDIFAILRSPLPIGSNRRVSYRFARQKSHYLAQMLANFEPPRNNDSPVQVRDWLMTFGGIGPKTASWIVRNWFDSDEVAIIDIHIHRAGVLTGFFKPNQRITRDYLQMERQFIEFSAAIGARVSALDALIWNQMRQANRLAIHLISLYHAPLASISCNQRAAICREAEVAGVGVAAVEAAGPAPGK